MLAKILKLFTLSLNLFGEDLMDAPCRAGAVWDLSDTAPRAKANKLNCQQLCNFVQDMLRIFELKGNGCSVTSLGEGLAGDGCSFIADLNILASIFQHNVISRTQRMLPMLILPGSI